MNVDDALAPAFDDPKGALIYVLYTLTPWGAYFVAGPEEAILTALTYLTAAYVNTELL